MASAGSTASPEVRTDRRQRLLGVLVGAAVTLLVGVPTVYFMYRSDQTQQAQLELDLKKWQLEAQRAHSEAELYRRAYEDAPQRFTRQLGALIDRANATVERKGKATDVIVAAQTVVSAATDVRGSVTSVSQDLDHEIDELKRLLAEKNPDVFKISEMVRVLKGKWPVKQAQIENDVRKMQTELGLVPTQQLFVK